MEDRPVSKSSEEWRKELPPELYHVAREGGTEPPFTGKYVHEKQIGMYRCVVCGAKLFSSGTKFDSGTGWPSFDQALPGAVTLHPDDSYGSRRTEVRCAKCGSHLGHVFDDPSSPLGQAVRADGKLATKRYCINSVCLDLKKQG